MDGTKSYIYLGLMGEVDRQVWNPSVSINVRDGGE